MKHTLDKRISARSLIAFSLPTIMATLFMSIYSSVDGIFVARLVGTDALSAVNIVMPLLMLIVAIGYMIGAGGNALIARKMGEGAETEARQNFSLLAAAAFGISLAIAAFGGLFLKPLLGLLGTNSDIYALCAAYAVPLLIAMPFALMGILFQQFFITEGKPYFGLILSVIGGILNIVLDYLLIAVYDMGIQGAAIATGIGYSFPALIGLVYFAVSRKGGLYFVAPKWDFSVISKASSNGVSEMISMLASSITMVLMNNILMSLAGSDGVAAITIILTVHSILTSLYMGYSSGIAPLISYNYGRQDTAKLKKIYAVSLITIFIISLASLALSIASAGVLVEIFTKPDSPVYPMAVQGFRISAAGFLFMGFNGFSSAMFTALNNGRVSAILSICRTLVFVLLTLLTLPFLFGITGVWIAVPIAEMLSLGMTIYYFEKMKAVYQYA